LKELPFDPYDFFGYIASGLVLVVLAQLTLGFPKVFGADLKPFDMAVTVLAVYIAGQIVAGPAKAFFEDIIVQKVLGSPTRNLLRPTRRHVLRIIFPGFYKPLPPKTRAKLAEKISAGDGDPEDVFLAIRYAPEVLASDSLIAKINIFRDQYGFARNVSFSLLFAAVCFAIFGHYRASPVLAHYSIAAFVAGTLLFYRYLKFYRQYSYELFNAYARMSERGTT
jgi:hypothetical protein